LGKSVRVILRHVGIADLNLEGAVLVAMVRNPPLGARLGEANSSLCDSHPRNRQLDGVDIAARLEDEPLVRAEMCMGPGHSYHVVSIDADCAVSFAASPNTKHSATKICSASAILTAAWFPH